jgi:hypothetical protein
MSKFTAEDKLQAVKRYLSGRESSHEIAKSLRTDHQAILKWVKQYEYNGVEAFVKSCKNYTQQFKLDVLNYMIEYGTSLNDTAAISILSLVQHFTICNLTPKPSQQLSYLKILSSFVRCNNNSLKKRYLTNKCLVFLD